MVHPEGVLLVAEAEGAVAGEAAVRAPVLHVDGQLVLGLVGDVRQRPDQDVAWEREEGDIFFACLVDQVRQM